MQTETPFPLLIQRTQEAIAAVGNQNCYVLLCDTQTVQKFRDTTFAHTCCRRFKPSVLLRCVFW